MLKVALDSEEIAERVRFLHYPLAEPKDKGYQFHAKK